MLCHLFLILICNTRFCVTPLVQFLRHCTLHESGKGLEIERTHKETRVIRKEISLVPFIQTWGSPYLPNCCTRTSAQAGGKLPYQQWSQCPTANHQVGQGKCRNKQKALSAGQKLSSSRCTPGTRADPGPTLITYTFPCSYILASMAFHWRVVFSFPFLSFETGSLNID